MKTFEDFKDQVLTYIIEHFEQNQEIMPTYLSGQPQMLADERPVFIADVPRSAVQGFGMEATMTLIKEMATIEKPNFACLAVQAQVTRIELRSPADLANLENMKPSLQETVLLSMQNRQNREDDTILLFSIYQRNSGRLGLSSPTEITREEQRMMGEAASALRLL